MAIGKLNGGGLEARAQHRASPLTFFLLTFFLAIPFLLLGAATGLELMPGLPIAGLMFVCPGLAALILTFREAGGAAAVALFGRVFDVRRIDRLAWFAPILLLEPAEKTLAFWIQCLSGTPIPAPHFELGHTLVLCALFFISAAGEELGWSGYVLAPLQARWGALRAGLIIGVVWAVYHYIALVQAHRSIAWIAGWSLGTVAARVILVWLYNNTRRSIFAASLFHMTFNVTWQLFPVSGSYYDPRVSGLIVAAVALVIILVGGPGKLQGRAARIDRQ